MTTMNSLLESFMFNKKPLNAQNANQTTLLPQRKPMVAPRLNQTLWKDTAPDCGAKKLIDNLKQKIKAIIDDPIPNAESIDNLVAEISDILIKEEVKNNDQCIQSLWASGIDVWNAADALSLDPSGEQKEEWRALKMALSCDIALKVFQIIQNRKDQDELEIYLSLWRRLIKTGQIWSAMSNYDRAESYFSRAFDISTSLQPFISGHPSTSQHKREEIFLFNLRLYRERAIVANELSQNILLSSIVAKCKQLSKSIPSDFSQEIRNMSADELLQFGRLLMPKWEDQQLEIISVFECAFEIIGDLSSQSASAFKENSPETKELGVKVLKNLAHAHLKAKNYSASQNVLNFLRNCFEENELHRHHSYFLMSIQALLGLEKFDDALKLLEQSLQHTSDVNKDVTMEKFKACYVGCKVKDHDRILTALITFVSNSGMKEILIEFTRYLFACQQTDKVSAAQNHEAGLSVLGDPKTLELLKTDSQDMCNEIYAMTFNCGVANFQSCHFDLAERMFQASMLYASLDEENKQAKSARILRCLALVLCKQDNAKKATEYLTLVKDLEPLNILNDLIMIHICMTDMESSKCISLLRGILKMQGFHPKYLLSICHEAMNSKVQNIARECLSMLFQCQKEQPDQEEVGVPPLTILRCLISLIEEDTEDYLRVLSDHLHDAYNLFIQGKDHSKDAEKSETIYWFAAKAWNTALLACNSRQLDIASRMLQDAGILFDNTNDHQTKTCECLLLACVIDLERAELQPASVDMNKLSKTAKHLENKFSESKDAMESDVHSRISCYLPWIQYQIACHNSIVSDALQLLSELKHLIHEGDSFIQMAFTASVVKEGSNVIKAAALHIALQKFQNSVPVNYHGVAFCLRTLIDIRTSDEEGIQLSLQAVQVLGDLSEGEYPSDEIAWLVTNAWNRGWLLHRFGDLKKGKIWMETALSILPHCSSLPESARQMMTNMMIE